MSGKAVGAALLRNFYLLFETRPFYRHCEQWRQAQVFDATFNAALAICFVVQNGVVA